MSELRKPSYIFLLRNEGKKTSNKVECFKKELFPKEVSYCFEKSQRYRIRVNGVWLDKKKGYTGRKYLTKTEFRNILWKSIPL